MAKTYVDSHGCTLNSIYQMPLPPFYDEVEENEKAPMIWTQEELEYREYGVL